MMSRGIWEVRKQRGMMNRGPVPGIGEVKRHMEVMARGTQFKRAYKKDASVHKVGQHLQSNHAASILRLFHAGTMTMEM